MVRKPVLCCSSLCGTPWTLASLLLWLQLPLSGTVCTGQGMEEGCFLEGAEAIYPLPSKETREVKGWRLIVYLSYKIEDA